MKRLLLLLCAVALFSAPVYAESVLQAPTDTSGQTLQRPATSDEINRALAGESQSPATSTKKSDHAAPLIFVGAVALVFGAFWLLKRRSSGETAEVKKAHRSRREKRRS